MTEIILTSSVLILLLAALRRVLRGRISPGLQYALWLLAAARLLIPGTFFTTPVSIAGAAQELQEIQGAVVMVPSAPSPNVQSPSASTPAPNPATLPSGPADSPTAPFAVRPGAAGRLKLVWLAGMVLAAGALLFSNLLFYSRLRKKRKRLDLPAASWAGKLPVYEADGLPSPCLFGVLRPAVYLNEAAMNAEHPGHILAHEYAHYRHGDHLWSVLRCVCLAVHWYNPLVWWAAALSRRDCELTCDAAVLRQLGEDERLDYGQTLLNILSKSRRPVSPFQAATTMTAGKRAMKERISLIIKQPKMRKITLLLVALLACLLAACAFGGRAEAPTEPADVSEMPAAVFVGQPLSSRSYDYSLITDPDEVVRLWELYQSFEYDGAYDPTGKGGWFVSVRFQFGDEPDDDADVFFILTGHGMHTMDGEDLLLKNIGEIYAEFYRASTSNPISPAEPVPRPETEVLPNPTPEKNALEENARSIITQIQNGAEVKEWLPLMNYMDWRILAQTAVDAGMDDGDGAGAMTEDVIWAITEYVEQDGKAMSAAEYLYILTATDGLDGAVAEGYSFLVYRMHAINPGQFAYVVLEMLPEAQQGEILDFFRYEFLYEMAFYINYEIQKNGKDCPSREEALHYLEFDLAKSRGQLITEITFHGPGESTQWRLTNGTAAVTDMDFESENPEVATVSIIGLIVAVSPGETNVTIHCEGPDDPPDIVCHVVCDW